MINNLYRLVDANINRLSEAIRVVEDISRFIFNDKTTTKKLKNLRHRCQIGNYDKLLQNRNIKGDIAKQSTKSELSRENIKDIAVASFKRAEQSSRVLEEVFKMSKKNSSDYFKQLRYELYDIEKYFNKNQS
ncbi:MAG: thiamine-phosphate pyrophosphorylase [Epsilonproteobacteria bacterium]|nr:MAG: thiamine-phosphate pyrophosphorylase [Campylobacterota bacterium]